MDESNLTFIFIFLKLGHKLCDLIGCFFTREACEEYTREIEKLSYKLLELISLSLGLPANKFNNFFKDQTSFLRLNYYPRCPIPHLALGVGRHKDAGGLTVLSQDDVGGLEVKRKSDGEWIRVQPTPDAYIVNVGDIIQVNFNDLTTFTHHYFFYLKIKEGKKIMMVSFTSSEHCSRSLFGLESI